jgi:[ribosomal protein S18]-alanine N-acetyltransferase
MRERRETAAGPRIEPARKSDLERIMEIEKLCFKNPWSRQVFLEEFDRDFARLKVIRDEVDGRVLAFINYWFVHDEVHVLNVATHPENRRTGLGRRLMNHVLHVARVKGMCLITLEVRRSNEGAIELYRGLGYRRVGVRPRYYENQEDALLMELDLKATLDDEPG